MVRELDKIDLKDVTFTIPVFIDNADREENSHPIQLSIVVSFFTAR